MLFLSWCIGSAQCIEKDWNWWGCTHPCGGLKGREGSEVHFRGVLQEKQCSPWGCSGQGNLRGLQEIHPHFDGKGCLKWLLKPRTFKHLLCLFMLLVSWAMIWLISNSECGFISHVSIVFVVYFCLTLLFVMSEHYNKVWENFNSTSICFIFKLIQTISNRRVAIDANWGI